MTEDEETACRLLGEMGLVDTNVDVARVVRYLVAEREACAELAFDVDDKTAIRARADR